ncbi:MAG: 2-C-methyl-D-erythritol 4-phosphate cytidylyltransferase [Gammaproteobacteria bacterium]|nr:2-C-methyl-D-erythritol 4-phosphate cytidylyltransferase [Gammaproteobacteria bacterium]
MLPRYWAVVPAAGSGTRMGGELPKQYLPLCGRTVIEHTLRRLLSHAKISGVVVAVAGADPYFAAIRARLPDYGKPFLMAEGGSERCHSVLSALCALEPVASSTDWVLVHDAVRPCLRHADIDRLMHALDGHPAGGLLGLRLHDTIKRVDAAGGVRATENRSELWRALTPQMFRLGVLSAALAQAIADQAAVTDECAAMERHGAVPLMVQGAPDNIKITQPQDLPLAEFYLIQQGDET